MIDLYTSNIVYSSSVGSEQESFISNLLQLIKSKVSAIEQSKWLAHLSKYPYAMMSIYVLSAASSRPSEGEL